MTLNGKDCDRVWTTRDINDRAFDLYRQLRDQRSNICDFASVLAFVRVRQFGGEESRRIADALWAFARQ